MAGPGMHFFVCSWNVVFMSLLLLMHTSASAGISSFMLDVMQCDMGHLHAALVRAENDQTECQVFDVLLASSASVLQRS